MESVAGKGMGMIASRDIKQVDININHLKECDQHSLSQGETILKEDPVLVLDLMAPEPERHSTLLAQFSKLGDRDKRKIEALYDFDPEGDANTKIMRIFKSNSIQGRFMNHFPSHRIIEMKQFFLFLPSICREAGSRLEI